MQLKIKKLDGDLPTPSYAKYGDAGMDVYSKVDYTLHSGERFTFPTGVAFEIPYGYEIQIRGRSGLAHKHGVGLVNGIGTIDHGYRGELAVVLVNHGRESVFIRRGDRIAQIVVNKIEIVQLSEVDELSSTERGESGFGSTGKN